MPSKSPKFRSIDSVVKLPSKKSERTRMAILNSAQEFLWTRPFREMTVGELMLITGTGRSAFYQYFKDLHELMETLLQGVAEEIHFAAEPWFNDEGDPLVLLQKSLSQLVDICYECGPILRAVMEASTTDERLELAWAEFLSQFDDAVTDQIEKHQAAGLISKFEARPVAVAFNRLDASLFIQAFGRHPRSNPEHVRDAIIRIWMSTLYPSIYSPRNVLVGAK